MKTLMIGAALAAMFATPVLAQSYSASYGSGNTVDLPRAERSSGAQGVGMGAYAPNQQQSGPYAYEPEQSGSYGYAPQPSTTVRQRHRAGEH